MQQFNKSIIIINSAKNKFDEKDRNSIVDAIKGGLYKTSLQEEPSILTDEDLLKIYCEMPFSEQYPYAVQAVNNVILRTSDKTEIGFYNCRINVDKTHTIITTAIQGMKGTVKELISSSDYIVNIKGDLFINKNSFPLAQMKRLNEILSKEESLDVASVYLSEIFGISKLVFKNAKFNQGGISKINVMPFDIDFLSDTDYKLEV